MRIWNGPITMESYANKDHNALQQRACGHSLAPLNDYSTFDLEKVEKKSAQMMNLCGLRGD